MNFLENNFIILFKRERQKLVIFIRKKKREKIKIFKFCLNEIIELINIRSLFQNSAHAFLINSAHVLATHNSKIARLAPFRTPA